MPRPQPSDPACRFIAQSQPFSKPKIMMYTTKLCNYKPVKWTFDGNEEILGRPSMEAGIARKSEVQQRSSQDGECLSDVSAPGHIEVSSDKCLPDESPSSS
jgi:hypothetical protein